MKEINLQTKKEMKMKNMIPRLCCAPRWLSSQRANYCNLILVKTGKIEKKNVVEKDS